MIAEEKLKEFIIKKIMEEKVEEKEFGGDPREDWDTDEVVDEICRIIVKNFNIKEKNIRH